MPISGNYDKGSFVGNYKDNTEIATTTANKSVGLDLEAIYLVSIFQIISRLRQSKFVKI